MILASVRLISIKRLMPTSVTNALPVAPEMVDQQVALWSTIVWFATRVTWLVVGSRERIAAPKEASVTKMLEVEGMGTEPNRTAVPGGELRVSVVERLAAPQAEAPVTEKTERKPVVLTAGSPFTVVRRRDSSWEKKVCETVFVGPTGGVLCWRSKGRRASMAPSPAEENVVQEIPAFAPVDPTQTSLLFAEAATVFGNSPPTSTGEPTTVRLVGSWAEMAIMVRVSEPALTANRF
jgi:hypothetical protein